MKYTFVEEDFVANTKRIVELNSEADLDDIFREFKLFLQCCGYVLPEDWNE